MFLFPQLQFECSLSLMIGQILEIEGEIMHMLLLNLDAATFFKFAKIHHMGIFTSKIFDILLQNSICSMLQITFQGILVISFILNTTKKH